MHTENCIDAPKYLDGAFFEDVLENGLREANVTTKNISVSLGSSAGENYCSQIYRVKLDFQRADKSERETTSVIVKSMPMPEELNFLDDLKVYHKEKLFYMELLPKLQILLDNVQFAPRCYFATKRPVYTIVFEDMGKLGYSMADRQTGLDEHHTKLALKKLGQFHAVSMVYAEKEPEVMSQFRTGLLDPNAITETCVLYKILYKYLEYEIKLVSQWKGFEEIVQKLREFHKNFLVRLHATQAPRKGELKVLNHGDFWVNNLLFKYEDNKATDVVFVDFQMSIFGSPGIDLNYFFHASVQLDVLKKANVLLRTYHESLTETLLQLGCKSFPTFEDIMNEFNENSSYGLFTLFGPLPVMSMDKTKCEDNSFQSLADGDGADEKMAIAFASKKLTEHLKYSLKVLNEKGGLDCK